MSNDSYPSMSLCPHVGVCGGCSIQHLSYSEQLQKKEGVVREALAAVSPATLAPIMSSPDVYFYRNKMEFSFGDLKDVEILSTPKGQKPDLEKPEFLADNRVHLGLHPRGRFNLVTPTPGCLLLSKESQVITGIVSAWATEFKIPSYVRKKNAGQLRHVLIREGKNTGERLVALVAHSATPYVEELAEKLRQCGAPISSFLWLAHDGLSDVVTGDVKRQFWGPPYIHEVVGRLRVRAPLKSFLQTNTRACEQLIRLLDRWMANDGLPGALFDLYCGVGTLGLNLAPRFPQLIGIETDAGAVEEAYANAEANKIANVSFLVGRVEDLAPQLAFHADPAVGTLIVDPPRAGLHAKALAALMSLRFPVIYYLSCNPQSLARDVGLMLAHYSVSMAQPMDFFPHTDHIETLVKLVAKKS